MKRKDLKKTLKNCIKLYSKFRNNAHLDLDKEFYDGQVRAYTHALELLKGSNDNVVL